MKLENGMSAQQKYNALSTAICAHPYDVDLRRQMVVVLSDGFPRHQTVNVAYAVAQLEATATPACTSTAKNSCECAHCRVARQAPIVNGADVNWAQINYMPEWCDGGKVDLVLMKECKLKKWPTLNQLAEVVKRYPLVHILPPTEPDGFGDILKSYGWESPRLVPEYVFDRMRADFSPWDAPTPPSKECDSTIFFHTKEAAIGAVSFATVSAARKAADLPPIPRPSGAVMAYQVSSVRRVATTVRVAPDPKPVVPAPVPEVPAPKRYTPDWLKSGYSTCDYRTQMIHRLKSKRDRLVTKGVGPSPEDVDRIVREAFARLCSNLQDLKTVSVVDNNGTVRTLVQSSNVDTKKDWVGKPYTHGKVVYGYDYSNVYCDYTNVPFRIDLDAAHHVGLVHVVLTNNFGCRGGTEYTRFHSVDEVTDALLEAILFRQDVV